MLNNRSLTVQFAFVFLVALGLVGAAFYLILDRIYVNELKSQAETVADNVDAFGSWVAQYGRVWVKDDNKSYLGHASLLQPEEGTPDGTVPAPGTKLTPVDFYSKNPALAQREFSEAVERSPSSAKFRLTSHNVMNPGNKPDAFEEGALREIRGKNLKEFYELNDNGFRYARAVYQKATCIACHGDATNAPNDVKVRYGTEHGFGFKEGDVAGIISVRLPAKSFWDVALNVVGVWELAMIVAAFVIAMLFMYRAVVAPVRRLTEATQQISLGKAADLGLPKIRPNSGNELHRLALATERLRVSINMAIQRLSGRKPPA
jgi:HAMP domain-containing protein